MKNYNLALLSLLLVSPIWGIDTTIKGGRMDLIDQGEKVLFRDGVRMKRGSDTLVADEMETTKRRDKINARGHVQLKRIVSSSETLRGFGKTGFYDSKKGEGYLKGGFKRAHMIYNEVISSTITRQVDIYAKRIYFYREDQKATAHDNVYGKTIDPETRDLYEFWSDKAEYFADEKKIRLTGKQQPRVRQTLGPNVKKIKGNVILYYIDTKSFSAEGKAEAVFIEEEKEEKD